MFAIILGHLAFFAFPVGGAAVLIHQLRSRHPLPPALPQPSLRLVEAPSEGEVEALEMELRAFERAFIGLNLQMPKSADWVTWFGCTRQEMLQRAGQDEGMLLSYHAQVRASVETLKRS